MRFMLTILLLCAAAIGAADLSITREGDILRVFTTNNAFRCFWFQYNYALQNSNSWSDFHRYEAGPNVSASPRVSVTVCLTTTNQTFWRLQECTNR